MLKRNVPFFFHCLTTALPYGRAYVLRSGLPPRKRNGSADRSPVRPVSRRGDCACERGGRGRRPLSRIDAHPCRLASRGLVSPPHTAPSAARSECQKRISRQGSVWRLDKQRRKREAAGRPTPKCSEFTPTGHGPRRLPVPALPRPQVRSFRFHMTLTA